MKKNTDFPELDKAIELVGSCEAVGRLLGVSGKAVQKWRAGGRLPRTEATGETNYAERLAAADKRISIDGLLASVLRGKAA